MSHIATVDGERIRPAVVADRDKLVTLEAAERVAADAFDVELRRQFPRERTGDTRYQTKRFNARTRIAALDWQTACDAYMDHYRYMLARPIA